MTPQDLFAQQQGQIDALTTLCLALVATHQNPQGISDLLKAHSDRVAGQASAAAYAKGVDVVVHALKESLATQQKAQMMHPAPDKAQ